MNKDDLLKELYDNICKMVKDKSQIQPFEIFKARNNQKSVKDLEKEVLFIREIMRKVK